MSPGAGLWFACLLTPSLVSGSAVSPWGSDRTGTVMAELQIDQTNLPRVQEGKQTLSHWPKSCICRGSGPLSMETCVQSVSCFMVCPGEVVFLLSPLHREVRGQGQLLSCRPGASRDQEFHSRTFQHSECRGQTCLLQAWQRKRQMTTSHHLFFSVMNNWPWHQMAAFLLSLSACAWFMWHWYPVSDKTWLATCFDYMQQTQVQSYSCEELDLVRGSSGVLGADKSKGWDSSLWWGISGGGKVLSPEMKSCTAT